MSDSRADRNLLFGVLAPQMDFISRDALVAAMNAWVLEKSKPLGQILLEQRALSVKEHEVLSAVVEQHIERHQGDARQSLIALGSLADVQHDLQRVADPDVHASLVHLATGAPSGSWSLQSTLIGRERQIAVDERFEILRPHAAGGLGEVYVAQDHQLNRQVALKRIHERHSNSNDSRARFLLEAEITGGLEHPGIVPVYGMGASADGRPYYAMRMIRGETLKEAIKRFHSSIARSESAHRIELRQLLSRFIAVCNAVEYAHSRGVIHRDLKPSNIMLGKYGETLVVDWGLVKALGVREEDAPLDEHTLVPSSGGKSSETLPGSAIGTPAYMSPEQAAGRLDEIGPASDIYSLGATLYTLLTGDDPFEASHVGLILGRVQQGDFVPPREHDRSIPAPLNAVCLKAMSLKPADRYSSCAALAGEIEHWLADEPVTAYRDPVTARVARWIKRHRGLAASSAALLAALFVGLIVGTVLLSRTNTRIASQAAETERQREEATRQLYISQINLAQKAWEENNVGRTRELLESQTPEHTGGADLRGWEWQYLWRLTHSELRTVNFLSLSLTFTPDGNYLIAGSDDGTLKMWDSDGAREVWAIKAHQDRIDRIEVSEDGRLLATRSPDGTVKLWDILAQREIRSFIGSRIRHGGLAISPDGACLATNSPELTIWSTRDGNKVATFPRHASCFAATFSPDGRKLAAVSEDATITLWDVASGRVVRELSKGGSRVMTIAFSPDGERLTCGCRDGTVKTWSVRSGQETAKFQAHSNRVGRVLFSRDGRKMLTASEDATIKVWDATTGSLLDMYRGHASPLTDIGFSPRGDVIASGSWDGSIRLWDAASRQEPRSLAIPTAASSLAFSSDNKWLAVGSSQGTMVVDASTGLRCGIDAQSSSVQGIPTRSLCFHPDGRTLASGLGNGNITLQDVTSGRSARTFTVSGVAVSALAFSPDGQLLATGNDQHEVALWNPIDGKQVAAFAGHVDRVTDVAFSPDGKRLASAGFENDKTVILWDVPSGSKVRTFTDHGGAVECVIFDHDGKRVFTSSADEMIRIWDAETGEMIRVHRGHSGTAYSLSLSPDGKRLASSSSDQTVKIWDVATGQELQTLDTGAGQLHKVAFSADGTSVAACGTLQRLMIWDARPLTSELRRDLAASGLVESLFATRWLKKDVIDALEADQLRAVPVRQRALEFAHQYYESPSHLNDLSWSAASKPGQAVEQYALALRAAQRAIKLSKSGLYLNTLAVAQYRAGEYAEALKTLKQSAELNQSAFNGPHPADVSFLAMAHYRLGHAGQAERLLEQLRQLVLSDRWKADAESQAFFKEAVDLISPTTDAPVVAPRPIKS